MKYIGYVREHFSDPGFPVVKLSDLRTALKSKNISDAYLKRLVNYMMHSGELKRITKGTYTLHDDITVVGFAFQPFYYGLENALTIKKLWEQGTNPIVVTTKMARTGIREFENANYLIQRIPRNLFFGVELVKYYDFWISVSDIEKTLIDFVYFKHYLREDVVKGMREKLDKQRLKDYLIKYPPQIRKNVLGVLKLKSL
jgi:predicted transcriptional regulator of viral defense system